MSHLRRIVGNFVQTAKNTLLIGGVFIFCFSSFSHAVKRPAFDSDATAKLPAIHISDSEILKKSQVSYRADGGFTGINSYGVIISCVHGRISVLKSLHDPHRPAAFIHQKGTMSKNEYLQLWKGLKKQKVFFASNIPEPKGDIADQFTVSFEASAGDHKNEFKVHGIGRPEACQH